MLDVFVAEDRGELSIRARVIESRPLARLLRGERVFISRCYYVFDAIQGATRRFELPTEHHQLRRHPYPLPSASSARSTPQAEKSILYVISRVPATD